MNTLNIKKKDVIKLTEYFVLGGVELQIEVTPAPMDYQRNTIVKPYLNYPGSYVKALDFDGKKLKLTAVVDNDENLEIVRGFWKEKKPVPLVSLNGKAGYNILFIVDDFVQKDHDDYFKFEIGLLEYIEWKAETRDFVNWKVDNSKAKPKCVTYSDKFVAVKK